MRSGTHEGAPPPCPCRCATHPAGSPSRWACSCRSPRLRRHRCQRPPPAAITAPPTLSTASAPRCRSITAPARSATWCAAAAGYGFTSVRVRSHAVPAGGHPALPLRAVRRPRRPGLSERRRVRPGRRRVRRPGRLHGDPERRPVPRSPPPPPVRSWAIPVAPRRRRLVAHRGVADRRRAATPRLTSTRASPAPRRRAWTAAAGSWARSTRTPTSPPRPRSAASCTAARRGPPAAYRWRSRVADTRRASTWARCSRAISAAPTW